MANLATIILDRMGVEGLKLVCCIFKEEKRGKVMILNNVPSASPAPVGRPRRQASGADSRADSKRLSKRSAILSKDHGAGSATRK